MIITRRILFLKKKLFLVLILTASACRHAPTPGKLDAFRSLPANRLASWQIDAASLRRSLIPLPKEAEGADLVSGVVTTERKVVRVSEPPAPPSGDGSLPDITGIPANAQFWLVAEPAAFEVDDTHPFELRFGKTIVQLPADLVTRATRIIAWGNASALGADLTIDATYSDPADAQRLAPSLNAVLRMARDIKTDASAQGNHILIHAGIGPADAGRLLLNWISRQSPPSRQILKTP